MDIPLTTILLVLVSTILVFLATNYAARKRESKLEKLILELRSRLSYVEKTSQLSWPLVYWVKDRYGVMLSCSDTFEEVLLQPRHQTKSDIIGRKDVEFWDDSVGEKLRDNDIAVIKAGIPIEFIEFIPNHLGVLEPWLVIKFPVKFNNVVIGVAGVAHSLERIEELKRNSGV